MYEGVLCHNVYRFCARRNMAEIAPNLRKTTRSKPIVLSLTIMGSGGYPVSSSTHLTYVYSLVLCFIILLGRHIQIVCSSSCRKLCLLFVSKIWTIVKSISPFTPLLTLKIDVPCLLDNDFTVRIGNKWNKQI